MTTCSVCGKLNDPSNMVCEYCGSDLIDESEVVGMYYDDDDSSYDDSSDDSSYNDYEDDDYDDDYEDDDY